MSKRNTPQRRHTILALLAEQGEVSVDELSKAFATSEVTIRKDLAALEKSGLLLRRYGGAVPMPQELISDIQPISQYKQAIARAGVARIREHARIIIDSGTTTAAMIPQLGHKPGLVVMTNSLNVARAISELEHEPVLLMTGGTWDPHSESFQGQVAEQVLRSGVSGSQSTPLWQAALDAALLTLREELARTQDMLADALGISGTPSYVVAEELVVGARGYDELMKRVTAWRQCKKAEC